MSPECSYRLRRFRLSQSDPSFAITIITTQIARSFTNWSMIRRSLSLDSTLAHSHWQVNVSLLEYPDCPSHRKISTALSNRKAPGSINSFSQLDLSAFPALHELPPPQSKDDARFARAIGVIRRLARPPTHCAALLQGPISTRCRRPAAPTCCKMSATGRLSKWCSSSSVPARSICRRTKITIRW